MKRRPVCSSKQMDLTDFVVVVELFLGGTEDLEIVGTSSCVFNKANGLDRLCRGGGIVPGRYRGSRNRWNVVLCVQQSKWT